MSREHAPDRSNDMAGDLVVGAVNLAQFVYGDRSGNHTRDIYRNVLKLPLFHHGAQLAGLKTQIRTALVQRGNEASERLAAEAAKPKPAPKLAAPKRARRSRKPAAAPTNNTNAFV
jgi:hypothetical protein